MFHSRIGRRFMGGLGVLVLAVTTFAAPAAQNRRDSVEEDGFDARILAPTLGRPVFVEPGGAFTVQCLAADTSNARLALRGEGGHFLLEPAADSDLAEAFAEGRAVSLRAPQSAWRGVYDLVLSIGDRELVARRCVAVRPARSTWRLAHLSDMKLGEVGSGKIDPRLASELNLLAPDAVICTGDYLHRAHSDPDHGWRQWLEFVAALDAPVIMAAGDHDDVSRFSSHTGASPVGLVELGSHRVLVLQDHEQARIEDDPEQIAWVERELSRSPADGGHTLIVTHARRPGLLAMWREAGRLPTLLTSARLAGWICGGTREWDGREFRELLDSAPEMLYVGTHAMGTTLSDGASGTPHYGLLELTADGLRHAMPGDDGRGRSVPIGSLGVEWIGPNDGTADRLVARVHNRLGVPVGGASLVTRLSREDFVRPWAQGAALEQAVPIDDGWLCRLRFDLPDKCLRQVRVGVAEAPGEPAVRVRFETPAVLQFDRLRSSEEVEFCSLADDSPIIEIQNLADHELELTPSVRFDGSTLPFTVDPEGASPGSRPETERVQLASRPASLRLPAGGVARLRADMTIVRVEPGRRTLQVYFREQPYDSPQVHEIEVRVRD